MRPSGLGERGDGGSPPLHLAPGGSRRDINASTYLHRFVWHAPAVSQEPQECVVVAGSGDVVVRCKGDGWLGDGPGDNAEGSLLQVLVACAPSEDRAWHEAAAWALERELREEHALVRRGLIVRRGSSEDRYVHVTRSVNRASIKTHGLDWTRMTNVPGIAGSTTPERQAVFLEAEGTGSFFRSMTTDATDVWAVNVDGLWLESAPDASSGFDDGWSMCASPIPPSRLALLIAGE